MTQRTSFTEKMALAAGSAALVVAPVAADAALVTNTTGVSAGVPPGSSTFGDISVPWDIDGDGNAEVAFIGFYFGTDVPGTGTVQSVRDRGAAIGIGAKTVLGGAAVNLPGIRFIWGTDSYSINVPNSVNIGPTLANGLSTRMLYSGNEFAGPVLSVFQSEFVKTNGDVTTIVNGSTVRSYKLGSGIQNFGFSFKIGGQVHYGWAVMSIGVGDGKVRILEWTYNDVAGEGVHVGTRAEVVPLAPSALPAVTLLALGAAGMRRWRKQKQAESAIA